MRTQAQKFRNPLQCSRRVEDDRTRRRVRQALLEVGERERDPLGAHEIDDFEPGGANFAAKLVRPVTVPAERALVERLEPARALGDGDHVIDRRIRLGQALRDLAVQPRAHREIATAKIGPPGRTTLPASTRAATRSAGVGRW